MCHVSKMINRLDNMLARNVMNFPHALHRFGQFKRTIVPFSALHNKDLSTKHYPICAEISKYDSIYFGLHRAS